MSVLKNKVKLFEAKQVRSIWDEKAEKWWFSVIDICAVLTDSDYQLTRNYWKWLKNKLTEEGSELLRNIKRLEMQASDGKMRLTDAMDTEQVLRLVQSIPSKKAEPFKLWLAKVGNERIDESIDPELSIARAIQNYRRQGYSENWINQRIKSIEIRKALTDEWDNAGVKQDSEYAVLTDLMSRTWSGMSVREYKTHKGLKKENLRDNMTNAELVLNMLAEVAATDISIERQPVGFQESALIAREGAEAAKAARKRIEKSTGKPVVSRLNAKNLMTDLFTPNEKNVTPLDGIYIPEIANNSETIKNSEKILQLLRANPEATRKELAEYTGLSRSGVDWLLKKLQDTDVIKRIDGRRGRWEIT